MTLLWTIMPAEMVLDGAENLAAYEEIDYGGVSVLVEKLSPIQCRIVRLLSTEPQDFLRPEIQPGTVLTYKPTFEIISGTLM